MKTVEIQSSGYEKRFSCGGWLVAANGYRGGVNDAAGVLTLGRHHETDEAFVLLRGGGYLVTAGTLETPSDLAAAELEQGRIYVVERNEWHALVLREGAQTFIVENADTGEENSDGIALTPRQRQTIADLCR